MTASHRVQTRRSAIVAALTAAAGFAPIFACQRADAQTGAPATPDATVAGHLHDWDFLVGHWTVWHHRLKTRLAGRTEWVDFAGTLVNWPTLGGQGNVGDNVMELPGGTIRGVGIRAFDAQTGQWSVWWLTPGNPSIDPPLRGGFRDGVGTFFGNDTLNGRPIKVRVLWSQITTTAAHWEQAFSPDGGMTWEINWISDFTRVRP